MSRRECNRCHSNHINEIVQIPLDCIGRVARHSKIGGNAHSMSYSYVNEEGNHRFRSRSDLVARILTYHFEVAVS